MMSYIYKFTSECQSQTTTTSERRYPGPGNVFSTSADKQTSNFDIDCSNNCPSILSLTWKGLSCRKMKWWAIHTSLQVNAIVRLTHLRSKDSHRQETFSAPSADKQTWNYDIECPNHCPSLSSSRSKGLSSSKIKWWATNTNLLVNVIFRLPHPLGGGSQGQKIFLAPSSDKQTCNYDIECSNYHSSLSTLRSKGLCGSKMKWCAIYTVLPVNAIVRAELARGKKWF